MAKLLALDNDMFKILEITHVWLIAANVYYRSFAKLIKSPFHFEDFEVPVIDGFSPAKVIKTSASSFFANSSSGLSFGFMKCSPYLKATQAPTSGFVKKLSPLMKIKGPLQPSVDGIIYPFPFVVGSSCNGNSEQFQFDYIF